MNEMRHRTDGHAAAGRLTGTTRMAVLFVVTAVLGMKGFLAASAFAGGAGSQANATLSLRQTNLGQILVSAKGRTLYLFMKDTNGRSACSGSCVTYWPPLMNTGKLTVGPGVKRSLVGTTKRADIALDRGSNDVLCSRADLAVPPGAPDAVEDLTSFSLGLGSI